MVTHIVIFNWRDDASAAQIAAFGEAMSNLVPQFSDTADIRHGPDLAFRDGNGDYALIATFADRTGWDAYQAHPVHHQFIREYVTPILANRLTIQI